MDRRAEEESRLPEDRGRQEEIVHSGHISSTPEPRSGNTDIVLAVCGFLLLAVAFVFGRTVVYGFVNYDDPQYVYDNPRVARGVTGQGIVWAFTSFYACNWHPLTWLSHMLDCQLFGLKHPGGHHLTNILLHAASVILLFLVLRQMTGNLWPSAFVAALFAIHPLHVESVAWVAERKDMLSGLFFMLTLAAYAGYTRRPYSFLRYFVVTALLALGLMAKPMLVTLPFVLLLLDYWPLGRFRAGDGSDCHPSPQETPSAVLPSPGSRRWRRVLLEKLPWLGMTAACCVVTQLAQRGAIVSLDCWPLSSRVGNAVYSYVAYLGEFLYPVNLAVFYPHPEDALPIWRIAVAFLLLAAISLGVLAWRKRCPYLLVGWLWYIGMLVPVIGLVQVGDQAMADRYTYLTQIGLYVALAWAAMDIAGSSVYRCWVCGIASLLVVAILTMCARRQVSHWRDDEALWKHNLTCTSRNYVAHNSLGLALAGQNKFDEAIAQYQKALEIDPKSPQLHNNLGLALAGENKFDEAIFQFQKALEANPDYAEAYNSLGFTLAAQNKPDEAIAQYQKALEIKPDYAHAHYNLGWALAGQNKPDEAIFQFRKALEANPDYAEAHNNLGLALADQNKLDEAIFQFQKALEIKPDYPEAHNNLARIRATYPDAKFRDGVVSGR